MKHQLRLSSNGSPVRRLIAMLCLTLAALSGGTVRAQTPLYLSALQLGGSGLDAVSDVATDANGNSYVTGYFSGTVDFDQGPGTVSRTAVDSFDAFVARYDSDWNLVWVFSVGNTGSDAGNRVAIDPSGNIVVRGDFQGACDFDPGPGTSTLTAAAGKVELFVAKYTPAGNLLWAFKIPVQSYGKGLAIDGSGNIILSGSFTGVADFNPASATLNLTATDGSADLFVARFTSGGTLSWAFRIGGPSFETANAVAVDNSGNIYVTGYFGSTNGAAVNFNPNNGTRKNLSSVGGPDMFVARYSSAKNLVWAFSAGGPGADQGLGIATDGNSVVVAGMYGGTGDFNPGTGTSTLTSASAQDVLVAKYSASTGSYNWAFGIGSPCGQNCQSGWGTSIAFDAEGDIHVGGNMKGTADFDPSGSVAALTSAPITATNCFAAEYSAAGNYISAFNIPSTIEESGALGSLDVAGNGDIYVYGSFRGTVDIDPSPSTNTLSTAGLSDGFIARYTQVTLPRRSVSQSAGSRMEIAPNPFTGRFTLRCDGASAPARIQVIDMMGRVVESGEIADAGREITLGSELQAGAYMVRIVQGAESRTMMIHKVK